ncbi:MAG TPA: nucleoside diphosphate kinase regulator [Dongiaceae bacterium]|nr:nucleoside diphosphate kinase regulator [Dongiaceae bacterium]
MNHDRIPEIILTAGDLSRLVHLTGRIPAYRSQAMEALARRLSHARVVSSISVPRDRVTMGSTVLYREDTGATLTATLAYPGEEDSARARLSVLTPEGCALLGLSAGQSARYSGPDGRERRLVVLEVKYQPEAHGTDLSEIEAGLDSRAIPLPGGGRAGPRGKPS